MIPSKYKRLKLCIALSVLAGVSMGPWGDALAAGNQIVSNTQLPQNGQWIAGGPNNDPINQGGTQPNNTLNITQHDANAVIKWTGGFNVGANGTVNFDAANRDANGKFNTLNYDASGQLSQIYGKINAPDGNIYIVNPSGVTIGNSAQINVGSLYVSNQKIDSFNTYSNERGVTEFLKDKLVTAAELMVLGHIDAPTVTFKGERVVIDMDRLENGDNGRVRLNVIGYPSSEDTNVDYPDIVLGKTQGKTYNVDYNLVNASVDNGQKLDEADYTYFWIKNAEDLKNIGVKEGWGLNLKYALRNGIDLTGKNFTPIGKDKDNAFTGKLDGLSFNIFGLNINRTDTDTYTGLFGYTDGAVVAFFNLISGKTGETDIQGGQYTGSLIGYANNTMIKGVTSTLDVKGQNDVGGLVGHAENSKFLNVLNTGTVTGAKNVGGIVGSMNGGTLGVGEDQIPAGNQVINMSHNLGKVTGDSNVGGLVGSAVGSEDNKVVIGGIHTTGSDTTEESERNALYNNAAVEGKYNVGGIVGFMENTTVRNVQNNGEIQATGSKTEDYKYHTDKSQTDEFTVVPVQAANAGGIAGIATNSQIQNAFNQGNVMSAQKDDYYTAGNVGGIVGSAEKTNLFDVTNKENNIRGSHNVGGIVGFFGSDDSDASGSDTKKYTVSHATNNGGDVMATGARNNNGDVIKEDIRYGGIEGDKLIIGNMGGIVGYMYGDHSYINNASNRGTVHSLKIAGDTVSDSSKAANVGGIVGKIDRGFLGYVKNNTLDDYLQAIKNGKILASVSNSYNTGDVMGYSNIGGIAGFMYNGEIINSYNIGQIRSTRTPESTMDATNMGGILGDTLERSKSRVLLYNVYNKGQIGDSNFEYIGRHVGGVVGRFSGIIDTAYNAGDVYNGAPATGGIVGYWNSGIVQNVFNTGNITVSQPRDFGEWSAVGGIVGITRGYAKFFNNSTQNTLTLNNAYNLGGLRSFDTTAQQNTVSGIVGTAKGMWGSDFPTYTLNISNVYTTGNMYSGTKQTNGSVSTQQNDTVNAVIYVETRGQNNYTLPTVKNATNAFYISPSNGSGFATVTGGSLNGATTVSDGTSDPSTTFSRLNSGDNGGSWRFYNGTTPILNAFMPKLGQDNNQKDAGLENANIQFGTAYNPFLSIIRDQGNITIDHAKEYINNWDSIAVYGGGLTLNGFTDTDNLMYGGTLYSDGALVVNDHANFGAASNLYGSSVTIGSSKETNTLDLKINGNIQATGNADGTDIKDDKNGQVVIEGQSVETYGSISSAKNGEAVNINGIGDNGNTDLSFGADKVKNPYETMPTVASQYGHKTGTATSDGTVTITAEDDVNLFYGNMKQGIVNAYGGLNVTSTSGNIFIDSDLNAGGQVTLAGNHEMVLDISNIGKVRGSDDALEGLYNFLDHTIVNFKHASDKNSKPVDGKIAIDMSSDEAGKPLDFDQYDKTDEQGNKVKLSDKLTVFSKKLHFGEKPNTGDNAVNAIYTWISNADQLNYIQQYKENNEKSGILSYNFALKNNIDASGIKDGDYKAIGSTDAYNGTFDGRDYRISGLKAQEGLFGTIGEKGTVRNLRVYSSSFSSTDAGAIAQTNKGTIESVIGLGNTVSGTGTIGGLVAKNEGTIVEGSDQSSIIGGNTDGSGNAKNVGGLAGSNTGSIINSMSNSAITGSGTNMGGIAGTNDTNADKSKNGVIYDVSSNGISGKVGSDTIGGIVGTNSSAGGTIKVDGKDVDAKGVEGAYNDSVILGTTNVGGIVGVNAEKATIAEVANGESITGEDNGTDEDKRSDKVGGLAGTNSGTITDGRNTGTITGNKNVGGLVGVNESGSSLKNLENGPSASIVGITNVGGIAGTNKGSIDAEGSELTNEGIIKGNTYVGGVAGTNEGTIKGVHSDITLQVNTDGGKKDGEYFGGIAGWNKSNGTITNATNTADINALTEEEGHGASYVGGVAGRNDGALIDAGNSGNVTGKSFVGGVAGLNTRNLKGYKDEDSNATTLEDILIQNSGNVTATQGGAGGIFGENQGTIGDKDGNKHIILSNSGNVKGSGEDEGTEGTGGIIGVNKGDISHTSLRNEGRTEIDENGDKKYILGTVTGTNNVGGVIGLNYGTVTGGRNKEAEKKTDYLNNEVNAEANSYYEYQILNNGKVEATKTVDGGGQNAGGLIGKNAAGETTVYKGDGTQTETKSLQGRLTAGYNTGTVSGESNVGGIVGLNEKNAAVDQVFSTLAGTKAGTNTVGGVSTTPNVGGIIGNNVGTLSNSYATHAVTGTNAGNAVGTNSGTISNVYSTNTSGKLIGENTNTDDGAIQNVYSFSKNDDSAKLISGDNQKKKDSYGGFDFDKSNDDGSGNFWKLYEGNSNPLLKVFLNKVTVDTESLGSDRRYHVTYKGEAYSAEDLRNKLHAANGKEFAEDKNTGNELLKTTGEEIRNAGTYDDVFWSQQIVTSGTDGNPNNLGYDVDINVTVDRAKLTVTGTDVKHIYGKPDLSEGSSYGANIRGWVGNDKGQYQLDNSSISDGGLVKDSTTGKVTKNVNYRSEQDKDTPYNWTGTVTLEGELAKNYTFDTSVAPDNATSRTVTVTGNSYITPAQLTIHANDTKVYAGWTPKYDGTAGKLVNGDSWDVHFGILTADKPKESQEGKYQIIGLWVNGTTFLPLTSNQLTEPNFLKNYNIDVKPGTLTVVDGVPPVEPDSHLDYFLKDAPWDRQENFRERKAEIHFIAGGMTL